ncbi:MAG: histidinol-phosphate transaminase, partial [Pseudomonadota bacterium]
KPDEPGLAAADIQAYLRDNGVIVREMGAYRLPNWLRISIGTKEGNTRCIDLLREKFDAS